MNDTQIAPLGSERKPAKPHTFTTLGAAAKRVLHTAREARDAKPSK